MSIPSPARISIRTCIGCRVSRPKAELIRIVRAGDAVKLDTSGGEAGRGAYLCPNGDCLETAIKKGGPARALKTKITDRELEEIRIGLRKILGEQKVS